MIGEPDAGKPHVRFDEGVQETGDLAPRLCPTLPESPPKREVADPRPLIRFYLRHRWGVLPLLRCRSAQAPRTPYWKNISSGLLCRASARKRPATAFLFRASRARPQRQGRALTGFRSPRFSFFPVGPNLLYRKSAPPKRSPATRLPCLQGAPPRAHPMRERQSPRLSAPARQRELLLFEPQPAPRRGPACGC